MAGSTPSPRRGGAGRRIRLEIVNRTGARLPARTVLLRAAGMALAGCGRGRPLLLTLVCVGARRMAALNRRFHGCAEPTDVLSFPLDEVDEDTGRLVVGEVVVCRPVAEREARRRGLAVGDELLLYALHGWLHLAGHDDHAEEDRRRMRAAERRILRKLGREAQARSCPDR